MASITVKNSDLVKKRLNAIADMEVEKAVKKATTFVHGQAKELAPYGSIKESIHMKVKSDEDGAVGKVYTNLHHAPFIEFGTGIVGSGTYPHKVKGLNLSYRDTGWIYTPDDGETFYYTEGQVAKPYMYPALKQGERYVKEILKEEVRVNLKAICKGG